MTDVDRWWFHVVIDGRPDEPYCWDNPGHDSDFDDVAAADAAADLARRHAEGERSRAIAAAHDLDDRGIEHGEAVSVRWVFIHLIEEYARHNGHADLLHERTDGAVGD